jgi:hypothetical protein
VKRYADLGHLLGGDGCVPYFHRREFLEENSRKSGRPAAHWQGGKGGYAVMCFGGFMGIGESVTLPNDPSPVSTRGSCLSPALRQDRKS